jgi:acyl-CoA thioesterase I
LDGRVIEVGAGSGANFPYYPSSVREVIAVEPERYLREQAQRAAVHAPVPISGADSRIILAFGANDTSLEDGRVRVDAPRSAGALARILDEAAMLDLRAFVIGPAPVDDPEQNRRIHRLSASFGGLCAERGVPFVDVIETLLASPVWIEQIAAGDGAHPGADGYDALAPLVLAGGWLDWLRAEAA